jgi:hypothetical protein
VQKPFGKHWLGMCTTPSVLKYKMFYICKVNVSRKYTKRICPDILVLVILPIWIDYFNGYARARSLGIAARIKIIGESLLVFTGL